MSIAASKLNARQTAIAEQYSKFALQFSAIICFWNTVGSPNLHHGNVSLLKMGGRQFGVTNAHVVDHFKERKADGKPLVCQLGNIPIDPIQRLHSYSQLLDLAVLDLSEVDAGQIRGTNNIPCQFHEPSAWPPPMPQPGDFVLLGGFPGTKRIELAPQHFQFGSFSSGATLVHSVQSDVITCRIEIEECVISLDVDGNGLEDLPGISGSPVMAARQLASTLTVFDLVGVVFEHSKNWDVLRIRPMSLVNSTGHIQQCE